MVNVAAVVAEPTRVAQALPVVLADSVVAAIRHGFAHLCVYSTVVVSVALKS